MNYTIVEKPDFTIVGMQYYGNNANNEIHELWNQFETRIHEINSRIHMNTAIGYDTWSDEIASSGKFTYYAAVEVANDEIVPEGMAIIKVPSNKYAVFRINYDVPRIDQVIQGIFKNVLPAENLILNGSYDFEVHNHSVDKEAFHFYVPIQ